MLIRSVAFVPYSSCCQSLSAVVLLIQTVMQESILIQNPNYKKEWMLSEMELKTECNNFQILQPIIIYKRR